MKLLLLHLSDIHVKGEDDKILDRASHIASVANHYAHEIRSVYIAISGDVAWSGKDEEFAVAERFLKAIGRYLCEAGFKEISFVVAPGNHDCDFTKADSVRDDVIASLNDRSSLTTLDDARIQYCTNVQSSYFEFSKRLQPVQAIYSDPLWVRYSFTHGAFKVIFDCINVAWMSQLNEHQGELLFPVDRYKHLTQESHSIYIALLHHPLNWHAQATYHPLRVHLRTTADLVLTGHEHVQAAYETNDSLLGGVVQLEAGALQGSRADVSELQLVTLNLENLSYCCEAYAWAKDHYSRKGQREEWQSLRQIPRRSLSDFPISESFFKVLNDPGAPFDHPGATNLKLSDIFVFPDMRAINSSKNVDQDQVSSRSLLQSQKISPGVLIQGSEKTGKTSLLYELFKHYQSLGFVPVLIKGADFTKAYAKNPARLVEDRLQNNIHTRFVINITNCQRRIAFYCTMIWIHSKGLMIFEKQSFGN